MLRFIGFYNYTVILTYMSLLSAAYGMVLVNRGAFSGALICLMISGLCDAFDGTVARSKKDRTEDEKAFGIQLDSLCDVVSFGVFPAFLCYGLGMKGSIGLWILGTYSICAVIRLAYFNVLEAKRQQTEGGCNKVYHGLPVTAASIILPLTCQLRYFLPQAYFAVLLHVIMLLLAFLFIWDVPVKKLDISKLLTKA